MIAWWNFSVSDVEWKSEKARDGEWERNSIAANDYFQLLFKWFAINNAQYCTEVIPTGNWPPHETIKQTTSIRFRSLFSFKIQKKKKLINVSQSISKTILLNKSLFFSLFAYFKCVKVHVEKNNRNCLSDEENTLDSRGCVIKFNYVPFCFFFLPLLLFVGRYFFRVAAIIWCICVSVAFISILHLLYIHGRILYFFNFPIRLEWVVRHCYNASRRLPISLLLSRTSKSVTFYMKVILCIFYRHNQQASQFGQRPSERKRRRKEVEEKKPKKQTQIEVVEDFPSSSTTDMTLTLK